jgi:hypothetical protein
VVVFVDDRRRHFPVDDFAEETHQSSTLTAT